MGRKGYYFVEATKLVVVADAAADVALNKLVLALAVYTQLGLAYLDFAFARRGASGYCDACYC